MIVWMYLVGCSSCPEKQPAEPHTPILCPDVYDEDKVLDVQIEIAPEEWAGLVDEYQNWSARRDEGLPLKPYHPLTLFKADGKRIKDAQIRLKGNPCCSWEGDKMQFVIAFHKENDDGRFKGLRKLTLDAPPYDPSILRERVALSYFQDAGIATPCSNHARLTINDEYYGLYTNIETTDHEFLQRQFPAEETFGNLYKWGYNSRRFEQKNNKGAVEDVAPYRAISNLDEMEQALDVEQALHYWAAETVINQSDGYWAGSINFHLYHHPERGWQYMPWDLDNAISFWRAKRDPFVREDIHRIAPFMDWILKDPVWTTRFRDAIRVAHGQHDSDRLIGRLDRWAEQIRPHVEAEPHRAYSMVEHDEAVEDLRRRLSVRDAYLCELLAE